MRLPSPAYPAASPSERKLLSRQKDFGALLLYIHPSADRDSSLGPSQGGSLCSGWAVGGASLGEPPTPGVLSEGEQASGGTKEAED